MRRYLPLTSGIIVLMAVGYLNVLAFRFSWYWLIWWFDLIMHALGGLGLGLVLLGLGSLRTSFSDIEKRRELVVGVIGLVMVMSFTWELFEFTTDKNLGSHLVVRTPDKLQQGAADTATDLVSDLAGVLVASGLFKFLIWRNKA